MGYLLNESTIITIAHQLRTQNKKVIFTHGTYDLFHAGHSYFLTKSKKLGDVLIVGIESDKRVEKFKGKGRPIIPLEPCLFAVTERK
jgi:D-beta-D-heptose 7-phosphate kinase/D-beta-D-heptose 1-phosphate adenosyltransferase